MTKLTTWAVAASLVFASHTYAADPLNPAYANSGASVPRSAASAPVQLAPASSAGKSAGTDDGSPKTLANGLYMSGSWLANWSYVGSSGTIDVYLPHIYNDSFTRSSGTLRLEFWATPTAPARGQGFSGYRLFTSSTFSPLSTRSSYNDVVRSGTFTPPPNGTYWLVLVLMEFDSVNCSSSDRFCIQDTQNSSAQETFGTPVGSYTDLWWNPAEPGWGVTITHHASGVAFVTWYTYDNQGLPWWFVASDCRMVGSTCNATVYETNGPAFGATFDPSRVTIRAVGSITLTFSGSNFALMSYSVRGVTASKFITRQAF